MSDMCFEDFDYDREDDLHSQTAELVEEKLKSPNKTHTAICPKCHGDGGMSIDGGCSNCHGTGEVKQQ